MKMIKRTIRNIKTDDHLSDLCLVAIELDYQQLIARFVKVHKNMFSLLSPEYFVNISINLSVNNG